MAEAEQVAGTQRPALEAADRRPRQRRAAAEHGRDIEAAFDGEVGDGAAAERADPQLDPRTSRALSKGASRLTVPPLASGGTMSIAARPPASAMRTLSASTASVGPW